MGESSDNKKKKTTFRKIEDGMIYQTENGEALAVGVPREVETLTAGEGKGGVSIKGVKGEVKGERYRRVLYDWHFSAPLIAEEVSEWADAVTDASGTCVDSVQTSIPFQTLNFCPNCNHSNSISAKYCNECGQEL